MLSFQSEPRSTEAGVAIGTGGIVDGAAGAGDLRQRVDPFHLFGQSIPDRFRQQVSRYPDRLAIKHRDRAIGGRCRRRNGGDRQANPRSLLPRSTVEARIAGFWTKVPGIERIGIHDRFLELGGDSLGMMRVRSRLEEACAFDRPIAWFFDDPTLAELAAEIQGTQTTGRP